MAASEKREYKTEDIAKRQLGQWQKRGYRVTRRNNALYIQKTWRKGRGGSEVEMCLIDPSKLSRSSQILFDSGNMACGIYAFGSKAPTEPHAHPNTDVVEYTVHGKGLIWVNAKSYVMDRGTAIHMPADAWHTYQCVGDEPFVFFGALDKRRTYRPPSKKELEQGMPGLDATVVKVRKGRTVKRDGKTSTLLIEPARVGPKTMGLGVARYAAGASGTLHSHENCEQVLYVQSGQGVFGVDGDEVMVGPGFAAFIPPGARHQLSSTGNGDLEFIFAFYPLAAGLGPEYPPEL
ncbi:MAG: cupin domain-containing protein [bacterium]|nr:cupin domain-containing protein [bacterium]